MDPAVNHEWTSSEVEEARSLIAWLSSNPIIYNENDDKNKKHNDIVGALHALLPSKTMQQVIKLYVNLAVEMHMMQQREEIHVTGGRTHDVSTVHELANGNLGELEESVRSGTHGVFTMGDLANEYNFGLQEEATIVDDPIHVFDYPLEDIGLMEMDEPLQMVENNNMEVLVNNIANDNPVVAPHQGRYWTTDEHRLFLCGLRVYGRGDWKNISRYFVTTRTAVQVSSHAQKYFKRQEKRKMSGKAGRQRYSINDVELQDNDPTMNPCQAPAFTGLNNDLELQAEDNSFGPCQAPTFTGLNNEQSFGLQAPTSSVMMNNLAQFWSATLYDQQVDQHPVWSEQQMMGYASALMEGTWNFDFVPACQQESAYLPPGQF